MRQQTAASRAGQPRFSARRGQDGVADLGQALARAESSRVLNLSGIDQRWSQFEDHAERPLFENKVLNRSIIMKYAPKPGELFEYAERRIKSTKVLFPLDRHDLSLGSFSGLVGQKNFSRIMSRHLNGVERLSDRDVRVLGLIVELPTLDPFLLYAQLRTNGLDISPVYFQLSETDRLAIQQEMAQAFTPLVLLCFPDGQFEAAAALGLKWSDAMRDVVLPQALRIVMPPLTSNCINVLKDTALASVVAMPDLLKQATQAQALAANPTPLIGAAVLYLALLLPLVRLVGYVEARHHAASRS